MMDTRVETHTKPAIVAQASVSDLRIVTIDNPLDSWDDETVRYLFNQMVDLKRRGFGARYGDKVLPVDTTDFVARHFLTCIDTPEGLKLIAGYRSIDTERCRAYNMAFPAETLALAAGSPDHAAAVRAFVESDGPVGYVGSWTVDPAVKDNPLLGAALRNHFAIGGLLLHRDAGIARIILGATLRFKVDRLLRPIGYTALACTDGRPLPDLAAQHLHGEPVQLMTYEAAGEDRCGGAHGMLAEWAARITF